VGRVHEEADEEDEEDEEFFFLSMIHDPETR